MTLENKNILQIDATVITGLLIFLTISGIEPSVIDRLSTPSTPQDQTKPELAPRFRIASIMIIPFGLSALLILLYETVKTEFGCLGINEKYLTVGGRLLAISGFGIIVVIIAIIRGILHISWVYCGQK